MQGKKVPIRICSGCMEHKPKRELVRVVKNKQGEISLDLTGKKQGRGAYICNDIECLKKAQKTRKFERSFSSRVPDEVYIKLESEMTADE